jgi:nucleoside-diphosphate-sugar epimerase
MKFILNKPIPRDDLIFISNNVNVDLRSMRGIITGYDGWFGTWMCAALDYMGCHYDRLDMRDPHPVSGDYCIHLAKGEIGNLIGILKNAKIKHVLFTSSGAVYDMKPSPIREEKYINERLFNESELPVNIARVFTVIGGGVCQRPLAVGEYITSCLNNDPIKVFDGGKSVRSYLYMADLVIWLLRILFAESGNTYDVGGAIPITMLELAQKVNDRFGGGQRIEIFKNNILTDPHPIYKPNCSKAKNILGLKQYTSLDTALDKTIEWERK